METIKSKIQELVAFNEVEPVYTFGSKAENSFDNIMKRQNELIAELIPLCRKEKTLLGRTVRFPMADSYALYLVTKVNARTVQLTWLKYCDAWVDDRLGYQGNISRDYVQKQKNFDDHWSDLAEAKRLATQKGILLAQKERGEA
jgi:hypothetical protein